VNIRFRNSHDSRSKPKHFGATLHADLICKAAMALSIHQLHALAALIVAAPEREPQPLARALGVSLVSINRGLEQHLGLSLRDWLLSYRMRSWRSALQVQADVLDSALDYFGALSTAYRHAGKALGMTPARLKKGGTGERIQYGRVHSNWGMLDVLGWL
jgi:methylphosphotriester-DNA--protein-cysteine methyltransferase